jgi:hypothetical protein
MTRPRPRWLALLVLAGLALSVTPARGGEGARLPPWRPTRVVDATGRVVGRVVDALGLDLVTVWVQAGQRDVILGARPDRIEIVAVLQTGFESADCTGPAWILGTPEPIPSGLFLFSVVALGPGRAVLVADGPAVPRTILSRFDPSVDPPCVAVPPGPPQPVRPPLTILDLDDWQAPFSLR